jgi:hypothetical protein
VVDQLQVIDLADPLVPVLQPTDISFDTQGVDPCGSDPDGKVIRYWDGKIYVGLKTTNGPELLIYDVSGANRLAPVFVGKLYDAFNHSVSDIAVNVPYVYLATGHDTGEVYAVDTANLNTATPVNLAGTLDATALYRAGNRLYAGRARATGSDTDFAVLDTTTPASPSVLGPGFKLGQGSGDEVTAVSVHGPYAFVSSTDSNSPLYILDITDPNAIVKHLLCTLNWSQVTTNMVYIDNMLFVVNRSNDMVRVIHDQPGSCS